MAVGDGVGWAGFYAVSAEDTAGIVDVVDFRVAFACGDAVGIGVFALLRGLEHDEPVYLVGVIPFLIGLALLVYAFLLAPRE